VVASAVPPYVITPFPHSDSTVYITPAICAIWLATAVIFTFGLFRLSGDTVLAVCIPSGVQDDIHELE
jgi:hypothetical protein